MEKLTTKTAAKIVEKNKEKPIVLILRKREKKKSVTWDKNVIDNEFMNKKKSNKCCIFKKPRRWDESDTDETSSDCSDHGHHHHDHTHKHKEKEHTHMKVDNTLNQIQTQTQTVESEKKKDEKQKEQMHVTWDESVIDNEFMNKKKSKKCCIFHKPRRWDESSTDESDSSMDSHMHDHDKDNCKHHHHEKNNDKTKKVE